MSAEEMESTNLLYSPLFKGMRSVAVRNSTHYGIAGYYLLMAIKAGMIGFIFGILYLAFFSCIG